MNETCFHVCRGLLFVWLLQSCFTAIARDIPVEILTLEDGLPSTAVSNIAQDRTGLLWVATGDGVARYDGTRFVVYRRELNNPRSLSSNAVNQVLVDSSDRLWVATTAGGLNRYNPALDGFIHYLHDPGDKQSISSNNVWSLTEGREGYLWIGTFGGGLNRLDPATGVFRSYQYKPGDPASIGADVVADIVQDSSGALWVATLGGGVSRLDTPGSESFTRFTKHEGLCHNRVWNLLVDTDGGLWAGTEGGLAYRAAGNDRFQCLSTGTRPLLPENVYAGVLYQDKQGAVWIEVGQDQLAVIKPDAVSFEAIHLFHGVERVSQLGNIMEIYRDEGGVLWMGLDQGLARIAPTWRNFQAWLGGGDGASGDAVHPVNAILAQSPRRVWVAAEDGGLWRLNPITGEVRRYRADPADPNALPADTVKAMLPDGSGGLWVGTRQGLSRLDPAGEGFVHWLFQDQEDMQGVASVTQLARDPKAGVLWVATSGLGLLRFDLAKAEFTARYRHDPERPDSLSNNIITALGWGPDGLLYICHNAGVDRFDPRTGRFTAMFGGLSASGETLQFTAMDIYFDAAGKAWVSGPAGLLRVRITGEGFRVLEHYNVENGLPHNQVEAIAADERGRLWLATPAGLVRLDPDSGSLRVFGPAEGLPDMVLQGSLDRGPQGYLYLGLGNGLVRFDPGRIQIPEYTPSLVFTHLEVMNQAIALPPVQQALHLNHADRMLSVAFAALDYTRPESIRYAYRLSGFDEDWIENGTGNQATYTNLPPGEYRLQVRSTNSYGVWQPIGLVLPLVMAPPPWRTWWAYTLYALALALLATAAILGYRRKLARDHAMQRERDKRRWVEQLHDLTRALSTSLQAEEILRRYLDGLNQVVPYDAAMVFLSGTGQPPLAVSRGYAGTRRPPSRRQLQRALVAVRGSGQAVDLTLENGASRQCLALPLRSRLEVLGVVLLERGLAFNAQEQSTVAAYGEQAGTALENARLFGEVQRLATDARTANRAKSDFLARMSHEIRTPMNGVLGMTELLLESELGSEQKSYAQAVQDSGKLLLGVINDILDFSRIEAGKLELQSQGFDLGDLVAEVVTLFAARLDKQPIVFTYYIHSQVPRSLRGDAMRLRQILINLIGNAFKFTDEGAITLAVELEQASRHTATLRFQVSDTGIGIPPQACDSLFDAFSQVGTDSKRRAGGSGLGLAICKQLVERMDGSIGVDSRPGRGSRFYFTVCLKRDPEARAGEAIGPHALRGKRVLLQYPDEALRSGALTMLDHLGADAQAVATVQELLAVLADDASAGIVDAVLCRWDAPEVRQVAASLRAIPGMRRPALVGLVPFGAAPQEAQWRSAGVNALVRVPLREPEVVGRLLALAQGGERPEPLVAEARAAYGTSRPLSILVVEDSPIGQEVIQDLLEHWGHEVDLVDNGREALYALQRCAYELVLMDCELPGMDGLETTVALRALEREGRLSGRVPVVALTAHASQAHRARCMAAGMDDHLGKPVTGAALKTVLGRWTRAIGVSNA